jgi:hypothetical protein
MLSLVIDKNLLPFILSPLTYYYLGVTLYPVLGVKNPQITNRTIT